MNNEQTSYFKRGLVLLMAVIMVFTYMPGGTWGADTAWADTATVISTANEFAEMDAEGSYKLGADITVTTPYANEFTGTFDGDGHTVTLNITSNSIDGIGFFSTIGSGAVIKNLRIEGNITYEGETENKNGTGSIAGKCAGTISNCENYANVSGYSYIGGIVGILEKSGKVIGCANKGNVSGKNGSSRYIGGVTGNTKGDVGNCYNQGTITSNRADRVYLGGISGSLESGSTAENCYSTSDIEIKGNSGGIIGWSSSATVSNCYFLEKDALSGVNESGSTVTQVGSKTSDEMKTENFVMLLNNGNNETGAFMVKAGDYPALKWETPTASVSFTISPANATLTITKSGDTAATYTGKGGTVALPAGSYNYTVSCEGYTSQTSSVTVSSEQANSGATLNGINVTLQEDSTQWANVTFNVSPNTATFVLKDGDSVLTAQSGTTYKVLKNKTYTYTATADGYEDESGAYAYSTEAGAAKSISLKQVTQITLSGTYKTEYVQGDSLDTSGLVVTATLSDNTKKVIDIENCTVEGFDSTNVAENQTITVTYKGQAATYTVKIEEKTFPSSVFNALRGKATVEYSHNDKYTSTTGKEFIDDETENALKSNSAKMGSSQVTVTIKFNDNLKTSKLKFQYKVSSEKNYDYLKINNETSKSLSGTINWAAKELTVEGGDTVTLAYVKDGSGDNGSDCVWFKGFELEPLYDATFTLSPADANMTLTKQGETEAITPTSSESGTVKFTLENGTYGYTVSKFGYVPETGSITVNNAEVSKAVTLSESQKKTVTFNIALPEGVSGASEIAVKSGNTAIAAESDGSYKLPAGTYTYTVTNPDCDAVTGSFEVTSDSAESQTVSVTLPKKLVFQDLFAGVDGITATDDATYPYEAVRDDSGNYLKSSSKIDYYKTATITLTATENVRLSFDYLGSNYYSQGYPFTVKNGNETLLISYNKTAWETFSADLAAGENLTLTFANCWDSSTYYVKLKNFTTVSLYNVTFEPKAKNTDTKIEDVNIEVKNAEGGTVSPADGKYMLAAGEYTYTASKFGYDAASGSFSVTNGDVTEAVAMTPKVSKKVTFALTLPEDVNVDSAITIRCGDEVVVDGEAKTEYQLPAGEYTYTITNPYCETAEGEFTVGESDITVKQTLVRKLVFNDFFDDLDGITAENDKTYPYEAVKDDSGNYLRSSKTIKNYGKAVITLTATKNIRLSFDYLGSNSSSSYYAFTTNKGSKTLLTSYAKTAWETFSTNLKNGESLTLTFNKPYSYASDDYCVKLKNFTATPIYAVTITSATDGADIVLRDEKNNIIAPESGEYLLANGVYKYTVSKYGYQTVAGTITVNGENQTINVNELQTLDVKKIRFNINVEGAVITVEHSSGKEITPEDGVYSLPTGEYSYSVAKDGFITVTGGFTTSEDKTINVNLVSAGDAWDGTTKTKPTIEDGVYQISDAEELAWFAAEVNSDEDKESLNAVLTANINLNGKTWSSFGEYNYSDKTRGFSGILDGNGKTISGLSGSGGLIDCVAVGGIVKNLCVDGTISGSENIGGIANTSYGTIENCMFSGSISNSANRVSAAGIVGRALDGNTVKNCVNKATITNTYEWYNNPLNIGGIVGYTYGTVENCYNTGKISARTDRTTNKAIGGIAGQVYSSGSIVNSYSAGKVTGPEAGIGAVVGVLEGKLKNVYYDSSVCKKAVAEGINTAQAKTAEEMKEDSFVSAIDPFDEQFNRDSDRINGGYPVLKWQGGTPVEVSALNKELLKAKDSLVLKMSYVKEDTSENGETYFSMLAEQNGEKEWNIDTICDHIDAGILTYKGEKITEDKLDWYLESIYADYATWLSTAEKKEVEAEADGTYVIESTNSLILDSAAGDGISISWESTNADIVAADGNITLPEDGTAEVVLTATLSKDGASVTKEFSLNVKSGKTKSLELLNEIKTKLEKTSSFIQAYEIYDHANAKDAMEYYLNNNGYDIDENDITVAFVSPGKKDYPASDNTVNIAENGDITYFTGTEYADDHAQYSDVGFTLEKDGKSVNIKTKVRIGWSFEKVKEMTDAAIARVTWEAIKGSNENTATATRESGIEGVYNDWETVTVSGQVSENLNLPTQDSGMPRIKIKWSSRKDTDALVVSENEDGSYTGKLKRPRYGSEARTISIKAEAYFDGFDENTQAQFESSSGETGVGVSSVKMFTMTIAPETEDISVELQKNLEDKYESLLRDFVDKTATIDTAAVSKDLQMPRPATLEEAGIMDRDIMKVKMESGNTDVLDFYGYHAQIYRPLPGEADVTVPYTIKIVDYYNESDVYAEKTFYLTVKALTQKEIDDATAFMSQALTEDTYWNGIKGDNADKNNVTADLNPFVEILQTADGNLEYIRGTGNITFGGIDVDELEGWYLTEKYREFKSSKPNVVAHETLKVAQPEYNTKVKIQSVLTHSELGKYWSKFANTSKASKYLQFKQLYMQPISIEITVAGTKGTDNPAPVDTSIKAKVSVDGKNVKGFKNLTSVTVYDLEADSSTAWDAVSYALLSNGYKIGSVGSYIASLTDPLGVTLTDTDTKNSGWLYTVNGKLPEVYMGSYYLKDGDNINLYYTSDWQADPDAGKWSGSTTEGSKVITTDDKTASTTTTTAPTETKVTEKTNADGTKEKTATVTVSADNQTEIIKQATDKKSTEIVLEVASTATAGAQNVQLQLNVSFVKNVSEKTDAALTVNTENGTVSLDQNTIKTVLSEAKGATITLDVNKVTSPTEVQKKAAGESGQILSLTVKSGDKTISDFKTGKVTVTVAIQAALQNKRVAAIHIAEDGKIQQMPGKSREVNGKKCYEFTTFHFSDFALVDADELGLETEDEIDAAALVAKLTPVARSAKTAKGYIKVTTNLDKNDKAIIGELTDAGYTIKYRFYRSTKKSASYKSALTKTTTTYTNTTGKKGTKYYYKVQVRVYDENGKLAAKTALKQCKYAARTR